MGLHKAGFCLHFLGVKVQTPVGVADVTVSAASSLVFCDQTSFLFLLRVTLSASVVLEGTLACKKRQAYVFLLSNAFMAINAIGSRTSRTVFTKLHVSFHFRVGLKGHTLVVIDVILSSGHTGI